MESKNPFYIIDDDKNNLATLIKVVGKVFPNSPVHFTDEPKESWKLMKGINKKGVVIANALSQGANGFQIMAKVRDDEVMKDSYVIIITSSGSEQNLKALKQGADDFISKPFSIDQIISKLRSSVRHLNSVYRIEDCNNRIEAMKEELESEAEKMKELLIELLLQRLPDAGSKLQTIVDAASWILSKFKEYKKNEIDDIGNAASLIYCGKLSLPDDLLNVPVMKDGNPTNGTMAKIPEFMKKTAEKIRGYKDVAINLYHVFENYDGTGIPEKKQAWQIPIGSRILRVAHDYMEILEKNNNIEGKAMEVLYHESKRFYDFSVVALFDQYLANQPHNQARERPVEFKDLVEGMILSRNIITDSGLRLMSSGLNLKVENIQKIKEIRKSDPIIGNIYVRRKK